MMAAWQAGKGACATLGAIPLPDDRVKREIEDILKRGERRAQRGPVPRVLAMRLTPERLMAAGAAALVLALIVRPLFVPFALAAVALFALGYVFYLRRGRLATHGRPQIRPAWRGRPVRREGNVVEFRDSWRNRLGRWLRGR